MTNEENREIAPKDTTAFGAISVMLLYFMNKIISSEARL
jgi:hypothetical protein